MKLTPRSRKSWRDWLERNHDSQSEVWVVFYKRHTGKATLSYDDAVEEALCFGWIDGVRRTLDDTRYTIRFSPRTSTSSWSALNRSRAQRMKRAGLMAPAGEKAIRLARRSGRWAAAEATPDRSMPPELNEALRSDSTAAKFFETLAPSYRRQFIGWINAARRPETRQRRVAEAVSLLSRGEKLGMR